MRIVLKITLNVVFGPRLQVVEESVRFLCCAEESSLESNAKTMSQVFSYLLWSKSLSEEEELKSVFEGGVDETSVQVCGIVIVCVIDQCHYYCMKSLLTY